MRILLINKYHFLKGGAERAYFDTAEILKSNGHEVAFFSMKHSQNKKTAWDKYFIDNTDYNDRNLNIWQKIKIAQRIIFNFQAKQNLEKLISEFKPDVAHLHNIYHQLSPSIIYALKKHNIPIVLTLHDYKLISPNYSLFLKDKIWEKKSLFFCVKDRCVKNSYFKSFICVLEKIIHDFLGSYKKINAFISPSIFLIGKFKEFNFFENIEYIPNPIIKQDEYFYYNLQTENNDTPFVYYGRLSKEKGIDVAIKAMKFLDEKEMLWIVGDGPEKENLTKLVKKLDLENRVTFAGFKSGKELKEIIVKAKAIIVPSVWYENMPYTVLESLSLGKIVIASNIGGISNLIENKKNGLLFEVGNNQDLAKKIQDLENYDLDKIENEAKNSTLKYNSREYYKKISFIYKKIKKIKRKSIIKNSLTSFNISAILPSQKNIRKISIKMMKIAFIGQKGIPAKFGGVERYVEELAKRLTKSGHDVFVYARNNYTEKNLREYKGINIIHLPSIPTKNLDAISHTFLATIHAIFQNYDVIHFQSIGPSSLSFLIRIFKRKTALIATYHCKDYFHKKWSWFARAYLRFGEFIISFVPNKTIVISKNLGEYVFKKFKIKLEIIPNGMSVSPVEDYRYLAKWNLQKNGYIVYVGRLIRHKGVHFLISAFKNLEDKHLTRGKKLVIVGDGFYTDEYVKELKDSARGRENIVFTGNQTDESLNQLFSHAYLFVQPSESEGLSLALLEAMGYGKAILSSDIKENMEPLNNETATFFRSGDVKDLEEKLVYLINNPVQAKKIGENAAIKANREYSWDEIVKQIEKVYMDVVSQKRKSWFKLLKKNKEKYAKNT